MQPVEIIERMSNSYTADEFRYLLLNELVLPIPLVRALYRSQPFWFSFNVQFHNWLHFVRNPWIVHASCSESNHAFRLGSSRTPDRGATVYAKVRRDFLIVIGNL